MNVCTECVAVNILGLSLPVIGGLAATLAVIALVLVRRRLERPHASRRTAALA
jgi:membrane protein implicated in regulation of membrane protease activity